MEITWILISQSEASPRRRLWLAGARPQNIKVFVGGALVAEKQGY